MINWSRSTPIKNRSEVRVQFTVNESHQNELEGLDLTEGDNLKKDHGVLKRNIVNSIKY